MSNADPPVAVEQSAVTVPRNAGGSRAVKIVLWTIGILAGAGGVLAIVGMLLPAEYSVERSLLVEADTLDVHAHVFDLKTWPKWNAEHPDREYKFPGQTVGEGAVQTWTEPNKPEATLKITWENPHEGVQYTLHVDGADHPAQGTIRYAPEKSGTRITWKMRGKLGNNPIDRWRGLLIDRRLGTEFETGLENLKPLAEKLAAANRKRAAEFAKLSAKQPPGGGGMRAPGPGGPGGGGPKRPGGKKGGRKFDPQASVDRLMQNDKNKDGKLSKEEIPQRARQFLDFDAVDANQDGFLTKDELLASMRKRRSGGKSGGRGGFSGRLGAGGPKQRPPVDDSSTPAKKPATNPPDPREQK